MITIDAEFKALIPPQKLEEHAALESSILAEGCRDALVLWQGTLIDGHNRYDICTVHGIPYQTISMDFANRNAVLDWIESNQFSRRNLSPPQMRLIRGRQYNRLKQTQGGDRKSKCQNDTLIDTAETLAKQYGVSVATIKRDGAAAELLGKCPRLEQAVIRGEMSITAALAEFDAVAARQRALEYPPMTEEQWATAVVRCNEWAKLNELKSYRTDEKLAIEHELPIEMIHAAYAG